MSSSLSLRLGKDAVFIMEDRVWNKKGRFAKRGVISRTEAATACVAEKRKHVAASAEGHVAATSLAATGPSGKKPFPWKVVVLSTWPRLQRDWRSVRILLVTRI